jgi:hypothetical protein
VGKSALKSGKIIGFNNLVSNILKKRGGKIGFVKWENYRGKMSVFFGI